MYFVTTKRAPYVLFAMSPSERFAIGVLENKHVHLLARDDKGEWQSVREWDGTRYSHTEFMASLRHVDEPADVAALLKLVPATV